GEGAFHRKTVTPHPRLRRDLSHWRPLRNAGPGAGEASKDVDGCCNRQFDRWLTEVARSMSALDGREGDRSAQVVDGSEPVEVGEVAAEVAIANAGPAIQAFEASEDRLDG